MLKKMYQKFAAAERGIVAIEMAFIMPTILLLYFGLMDITGLVSANRKITASASITADLVGQQKTSIIKATIDDQYNATAMIMSPTDITKVRVEVFGYRKVSGAAAKIWHTSNNNGPACSATDPDTTNMLTLMAAGNDLIVARSCMTFTPYVTTFFGNVLLGSTSFLVKQTISVRPRSSLDITCYTTSAKDVVCT